MKKQLIILILCFFILTTVTSQRVEDISEINLQSDEAEDILIEMAFGIFNNPQDFDNEDEETLTTLAFCNFNNPGEDETFGTCYEDSDESLSTSPTEIYSRIENDGENNENNDESGNEDYLDISDASIEGSEIRFNLDRRTAEQNDVNPTLELTVNGERYTDEEFSDTEGEQVLNLNLDSLRKEFGSGELRADLKLESKDDGDYQWNSHVVDLGKISSKCPEGEIYSDYAEYDSRHKCVSKDDLEFSLGLVGDDPLATFDSNWNLEENGETKYRLDQITVKRYFGDSNQFQDFEEPWEKDKIVMDIGGDDYCGEIHLENNNFLSNIENFDRSEAQLDIKISTSGNDKTDVEGYVEINNDEKVLLESPGQSEEINVNLDSNDDVKVGLRNKDSFSCAVDNLGEFKLEAEIIPFTLS